VQGGVLRGQPLAVVVSLWSRGDFEGVGAYRWKRTNERESREHFDVKDRQKKCPLWKEVCPRQGQGMRDVVRDEVVTVDKTTKTRVPCSLGLYALSHGWTSRTNSSPSLPKMNVGVPVSAFSLSKPA